MKVASSLIGEGLAGTRAIVTPYRRRSEGCGPQGVKNTEPFTRRGPSLRWGDGELQPDILQAEQGRVAAGAGRVGAGHPLGAEARQIMRPAGLGAGAADSPSPPNGCEPTMAPIIERLT